MNNELLNLITRNMNSYILLKKSSRVIFNNIPSEMIISKEKILKYKKNYYMKKSSNFIFKNVKYSLISYTEITDYIKKINIDSKTGIYSHDGFKEKIKYLITNKIRFNFGILDIDNFKKINDKYGHSNGDLVLHDLSTVFKNNIENNDFIGRFGGDEFLFVFPNISIEEAINKLKGISNIIKRETKTLDNKPLNVTVSIGLKEYDFNMKYSENLIDIDNRLYLSKNKGKNNIYCEDK